MKSSIVGRVPYQAPSSSLTMNLQAGPPGVLATKSASGFTLVELLIAAAVSAIILTALATAAVQLQRNFASHKDYSKGMANQLILSDYLALDLRRALSITALADNVVTLQIPDYYAADGKTPLDPIISLVAGSTSRVFEAYYGAAANASVQVRYYKIGDTVFRREGTRGALAIADHVDFDVGYPQIPDPDNAAVLINDTGRVSVSIEFTPTVKRRGLADADRQTFLFNTVTLRNVPPSS